MRGEGRERGADLVHGPNALPIFGIGGSTIRKELRGLCPATNRGRFTADPPQNFLQLSDDFSSVRRVETWHRRSKLFLGCLGLGADSKK